MNRSDLWNPAKDWVGWLLIAALIGGSVWGYFHPRRSAPEDAIREMFREMVGQEIGRHQFSVPLYWKAVAPYEHRLSIHDGPGAFLRQFEKIPAPAGHLLATSYCQGAVEEGGFEEFFASASGVLAPEAAAGFRALGLADVAEVVEQAMEVFPRPYPRDRDIRARILSEKMRGGRSGGVLGALDRKFIELLSSRDGESPDRFEAAANRYAQETLPL